MRHSSDKILHSILRIQQQQQRAKKHSNESVSERNEERDVTLLLEKEKE